MIIRLFYVDLSALKAAVSPKLDHNGVINETLAFAVVKGRMP